MHVYFLNRATMKRTYVTGITEPEALQLAFADTSGTVERWSKTRMNMYVGSAVWGRFTLHSLVHPDGRVEDGAATKEMVAAEAARFAPSVWSA